MKNIPLLLIVAFVLWSCSIFAPCNEEIIKRVESPDGRVEAVIVKSDCGATTSYTYGVYIVVKGGTHNENDLVFKADHQSELNIIWNKAKLLEINYKQARIFQFTNFWHSRDVDEFRYVVEVKENSFADSSSLSLEDRFLRE